jgi:predicted ATPase/Tfp pilus assembly protein PilF
MSQPDNRIIQGYARRDRIGQGGMGEVYRGLDTHTGALVALKCLRAEFVIGTPGHLERFKREGEMLRQLDHPNIVKMLAAIEDEGQHYIVMEYVGGGSLRDLLDQTPRLPVDRALSISLELADALTRAHHLKIIHRDLKPANVLLAEDGTPRLTDFGTAYLAGTPHVTQEGMWVGTPHYLSPEAINQLELDGRADIWSFGVMLFEMLAGQRPFGGNTVTALAMAILNQPTPDLETLRPDTPVALMDLVYRMLEKDRNSRIPSVRLIGAELEAIMQGASLRAAAISESGAKARFATRTPPTEGAPRHNLPAETTPFIGRDNELAELALQFADGDARLITILGPGGVGKTRLALEAAAAQLDTFAHGVYWVPLAPVCMLCPEEDLVTTVAEVVGCQFHAEDRPESPHVGEAQKQQLLDYLREKSLLLVMDNFEHVVGASGLVADILQAAPGVRVLATSRERLNLQGEILVRIQGMDFPEDETLEHALDYSAVKLFVQSARRVRPDFASPADDVTYDARVERLMQSQPRSHPDVALATDDLAHIVHICRQVLGMPLGILLAAAWVEMLSPEEIAHEISQSLDFLETEMRNVPARHRSMRAVFESSWGLLSEAEQDVYEQLSVFRGGFTREAAQQVTGVGLRVLMALVNKSLLQRTPEGRYVVHNVLRQYAAERLATSPDKRDRVYDRHCETYAEFLHQQEMPIRMGKRQAALEEIDNLRAAWGWAIETRKLTAIKKSLGAFFVLYDAQSWYQEAIVIMTQAVQALRSPDPQGERGIVYGQAVAFQGGAFTSCGQAEEGHRLLFEGIEILRRLGARQELAVAQSIAVRDGAFYDVDEAKQALRECIDVFREYNMSMDLVEACSALGFIHYRQQELEEMQDYFEEAYAISKTLGTQPGLARTLSGLGLAAASAGDYAKARPYFQEALALWRALGIPAGASTVLTNWGLYAWKYGDYAEAKAMLQESLVIAREAGNSWWIANCLNNLGHPTAALGQYDEAASYYREALMLMRGRDVRIFPAIFLEAVMGLANITAKTGDTSAQERAVEWLAMVSQHPLLQPDVAPIAAQHLDELRTELQPDAYAAAEVRGKQLSLEDVVARLLA